MRRYGREIHILILEGILHTPQAQALNTASQHPCIFIIFLLNIKSSKFVEKLHELKKGKLMYQILIILISFISIISKNLHWKILEHTEQYQTIMIHTGPYQIILCPHRTLRTKWICLIMWDHRRQKRFVWDYTGVYRTEQIQKGYTGP